MLAVYAVRIFSVDASDDFVYICVVSGYVTKASFQGRPLAWTYLDSPAMCVDVLGSTFNAKLVFLLAALSKSKFLILFISGM